jgi:Protein of unknown function (DUF2992)
MSDRTVCSIIYDGQFWIALIERFENNTYCVARHIFGAEPTNAELLEWAGRRLHDLNFTEPVVISEQVPVPKEINPKRRMRLVQKETAEFGVSSKAQEAMRMALETKKKERRLKCSENSEAEALEIFEKKKAKKREKLRGH